MTKNQKIVFFAILGLGIFLIFFHLGRPDMLSDDGHYAFRSLGYFDYLGSEIQTTPVQWFDHRPAWSYLSFHDHPPLYFFLQHMAFKIFGGSVVVSRFVSAFSAALSLVLIYFTGKAISGPRLGLLSMGALAINSYFLWMGRIGHLESLLTVFLLAGMLYFVKAPSEPGYFLAGWFFFGLALLTKYSFLYILPGLFFYLILWEHRVFAQKKFWLGALLFLVMALPLVIYNLEMYRARGHFDVQLADLTGQSNSDWKNLGNRVAGVNLNPWGFISTVAGGVSWPYFALFLGVLPAVFYGARRAEKRLIQPYLWILFSMAAFFVMIGSASRWVPIITPMLALVVAYGAGGILKAENQWRYAATALFIIIGLFSILYSLNTNHLRRPFGGRGFSAPFRFENYGYNQLDKILTKYLYGAIAPAPLREMTRAWWYGKISPAAINFPSIYEGRREFHTLVVYDSNTIWFPMFWAVEKWKFYHRLTLMSTEEFMKVINQGTDEAGLRKAGYEGVYFIEAVGDSRQNRGGRLDRTDEAMKILGLEGGAPGQIVYDDQHREEFYIYQKDF